MLPLGIQRVGNVKIKINGDDRIVPEGTTVAGLLEQLNLDPKFLAVERNRELVPRSEHAACVLADGDEIEIVTLVGGG
jgi:sulfur carrier protein